MKIMPPTNVYALKISNCAVTEVSKVSCDVDLDLVAMLRTIDPKKLAHCKLCRDPLYAIYDQKLRRYCYQCELEMRIDKIV